MGLPVANEGKAESGSAMQTQAYLNRRSIFEAARTGEIEAVQDFLRSGVDVNDSDRSNWTPLMYAAWKGQVEVVRMLVGAGANVDADAHSLTALMWACSQGHLPVVVSLLESGADPRVRNASGETALDVADDAGQDAIVECIQAWIARDDLLALESQGDAP